MALNNTKGNVKRNFKDMTAIQKCIKPWKFFSMQKFDDYFFGSDRRNKFKMHLDENLEP